MQFSIERELQLMAKYNLTAEELFVILLIFSAQEGHTEYITTYYSQVTPEKSLLECLQSLQDKGIINKTYKIPAKGTRFEAEDVDFNHTVLKQFIQHSYDMGMELFMAYPATTFINGKEFSLRNIAKNFKSFDDFTFQYGKNIRWDPAIHQEIMELLEWAKDNNLIQSGICDFVISHKWLEIKQLKDEGGREFFNTNEVL